MDGWYEVHTAVCHGCAAKDTHLKGQGEKTPPGELVGVTLDPGYHTRVTR